MEYVAILACLSTLPAPLPAASTDELAPAKELLLTGKYAEAEEIFRRLAPASPEAVLGLARTLAAGGRSHEATELLAHRAGDHAPLHAELARLALLTGDYGVADAHARIAIALEPDQLLARWVRAELLRLDGRLDEANRAYGWFIRYHRQHDVARAESLRWIGLAGAQHARWNRQSGQFLRLVDDLYARALEIEPDYWPAHLESGLLFLEKHNRADASWHLTEALKTNSSAAQLHAAAARLALDSRDYLQAENSVQRALELNPNLLDAWLVKADLAWANFDPTEAKRLILEKGLRLNPVCQETLGRLAACYVLENGLPGGTQQRQFDRLVAQVTQRNPACGQFFFTLASWLEERHRMPEAERFFGESVRRMPQMIGPMASLGLMSMHAGREDRAKELLEEAFRNDPFNVRVSNMLQVLEVLSEMETVQTDQCVVRFHGPKDALLAKYLVPYADNVYRELCDHFGFRPPHKPVVEIFCRARGAGGHQWFSTRMTGLPYLGTVAACTGRVVAMVSPNDSDVKAKYNWARVIRHEMVHVITLQQTGYNCPHWYTEALAVWSEGCPRPRQWNQLLARRVPTGDLFNLDTINFGFTRPHSSEDWQMAYCQAELYVEYMLDQYGRGATDGLLKAYTDNLTTPEALRRVFGVSKGQFEQGYREYVQRVADELGPTDSLEHEDFIDLLEARRKTPDNPQLAARLAYAYLRRGADREAGQLAQQAADQDPTSQLAGYVLARLAIRRGQTQRAVELLQGCLDGTSPHPKTLNLLASLKLKAGDYDEASRLYELGVLHNPNEPQWHEALAQVYVTSGQRQKLAEVLRQLADMVPDDPLAPRTLAQMALSTGDYAAAVRWANRALEVDVTNEDIHGVLAEAHLGRHNYDQAIEQFQIAIDLAPEVPQRRLGLANALNQAGDQQGARRVLEDLLRREPSLHPARRLLESLEGTADRE